MCEDTNIYEAIDSAVAIFSLLADPTRVRIILALKRGEMAVGTLAEQVGKNPTAVSQHLSKLRLGKIVCARREGNHIYYSLASEHAHILVEQAVYQAEHIASASPLHHKIQEDVELPSTIDRGEML